VGAKITKERGGELAGGNEHALGWVPVCGGNSLENVSFFKRRD